MAAAAVAYETAPPRTSLLRQLLPFCMLALALTVVAPLWLLLLSPLLLGVPHVVADIRYLLLTRRQPRAVVVAILIPLALQTLLRITAGLMGSSFTAAEAMLGVAAVAGALAAGRSTSRAAWLATGALAAVVLARPDHVALALGHLHNLIAIGLWLAWARASLREATAVVGLIAGCGGAVGTGLFDTLAHAAGAFRAPASGLDLPSLAQALAPGIGGVTGIRVVLLFAFAQALHYAVWLALLPAAAARPGGRGSGSLRLELGTKALAVAVLLCLLVPLAGVFAPAPTRAAYLSVVLFHGWLEIALIARWASGRGLAPWNP